MAYHQNSVSLAVTITSYSVSLAYQQNSVSPGGYLLAHTLRARALEVDLFGAPLVCWSGLRCRVPTRRSVRSTAKLREARGAANGIAPAVVQSIAAGTGHRGARIGHSSFGLRHW